jgi:hypothetical protein
MYRKERIRKKAINIYIEQKKIKKKPLTVNLIFFAYTIFSINTTTHEGYTSGEKKKKNRGVIELCISVSFD